MIAASSLKSLLSLILSSLIVKEHILSEIIFKAESFIGSNSSFLALFRSGSRVKFDFGRLVGWGLIVYVKSRVILGTLLFIMEVIFFLSGSCDWSTGNQPRTDKGSPKFRHAWGPQSVDVAARSITPVYKAPIVVVTQKIMKNKDKEQKVFINIRKSKQLTGVRCSEIYPWH